MGDPEKQVPEQGGAQGQPSGQPEPTSTTGQEGAGSDTAEELKRLRKQVADLERLKSQLQSEKDKTAAELEKTRRDLALEVAELRRQIQALLPPEQQREWEKRKLEAELEVYRQREELAKLRSHLAQQYGVPVDVLKDVDTGPDMVAAALAYLSEQAQGKAAGTEPASGEPAEEEKKPTESKVLSPPTGATVTPPATITRKALEERAAKILEERGWRRSQWGRALLMAQRQLEAEMRGATPRKSSV